MKNKILKFWIGFFLFTISACGQGDPCKCWKYSHYSENKEACDRKAKEMGYGQYSRVQEECIDFSYDFDKTAGYTKKDMVAIYWEEEGSFVWTEVYVKED